MVHNPLNNSPAKEMHSFAHGSRFPALNTNTRNTSFKTFDKKSDFDKIVEKGRGKPEHAFGSRHSRFHYYPDMRNSKVGPANYKEMDAFSPKTIFQKSSKYSFGLGREEMKKDLGTGEDIIYDETKFSKKENHENNKGKMAQIQLDIKETRRDAEKP